MSIKKGDVVQVITGSGKDRGGRQGQDRTGSCSNQGQEELQQTRVIVEGVNVVTKHLKVGQTGERALRPVVL